MLGSAGVCSGERGGGGERIGASLGFNSGLLEKLCSGVSSGGE